MVKRVTRLAAVGAGLAVVLGAAGFSTAAYADGPLVPDPSYTPPVGSDPAATPPPLQQGLPDNGCYLRDVSFKNPCSMSSSSDASTTWGQGYKLTLNYGSAPEDVLYNDSGMATHGPAFTKVTVQYGLPWTFADKLDQPQKPTGAQIETYVANAADGSITFPVISSDTFADMSASGYNFYNVWYQFSGADDQGRVWTSDWQSSQVTPTVDGAVTAPVADATKVGDDDIDVSAGGSIPVTTSTGDADALDGYKVTVYQNNSLVDTVTMSADDTASLNTMSTASFVAGAKAKKPAATKVSHLFANLKKGTYRFYVSAYNNHGRSQILRTKTVNVGASKLASAKSLKASNGKKLAVSWVAPKGKIAGYTVQVRKGATLVQSVKAKASVHKLNLKKLAAGSYAVRVITKDKSGHTSVAQTTVKVKVSVKA